MCQALVDPGELEHDAPRLDDGDPVLRGALARAHARLGRLLGDGLVREDVDPDLAATADLARHRDTGSLDLPVRDPAGLERLEAVIARLHGRLALREAPPAASLVLAELGFLRKQHQLSVFSSVSGCLGSSACGASAVGSTASGTAGVSGSTCGCSGVSAAGV